MDRLARKQGPFGTVSELIATAVTNHGPRTAVRLPDREVTYTELGELMSGAAALLHSCRLIDGDRVAIVGPTELPYIVAYGAAQCCGMATVEAGHRESLEMLRDMVLRSEARLVVTEREDLRASLHGRVLSFSFAEFMDRSLESGLDESIEKDAREVRPADSSAIVFTSGTTGTPKGVMLSHANFAFVVPVIMDYLELQNTDRYALVLPLNHTYGKTVMLSTFGAGGTLVVLNNFTDLPAFLGDLSASRSTVLSMVPYHAQILLQRGDLSAADLSSLRAITFSGNKLVPQTQQLLKKALPGVEIFSMYGLTESTTRAAFVPPEQLDRKSESCGKGLPGVTIRIVDDRGRILPPKVEGEVLIQGPNIMQGYLGDPELTTATLAGGWLHTGDLGYVDEDGFLYLSGRKNELIKCAGERISPLEIENVLLAHPMILEAAVVGEPDPLLGETVVAHVVPRGDRFDRAAIARFCATRLSPHKLPRRYVQETELPKTATGKVKRNLLRAKSMEERA